MVKTVREAVTKPERVAAEAAAAVSVWVPAYSHAGQWRYSESWGRERRHRLGLWQEPAPETVLDTVSVSG
jgi:hypothetical protein